MKVKKSVLNPTLNQFASVAEGIQKLLHPYAEVVIHDLKTNKIAAIYGNFSKRKPGDDSLTDTDDIEFSQNHSVIGPYSKINWDGRKCKSISAVLKDPNGKPVGLLCINLDVSHFELVSKTIQSFVSETVTSPGQKHLFKSDWREKVNIFIDQHLRSKNKSISSLTKEDQKDLICLLEKEGGFEGKNAAAYIANVLGISRATVYNYLKSK